MLTVVRPAPFDVLLAGAVPTLASTAAVAIASAASAVTVVRRILMRDLRSMGVAWYVGKPAGGASRAAATAWRAIPRGDDPEGGDAEPAGEEERRVPSVGLGAWVGREEADCASSLR